jgi:hypothetical protein
VVGHRHAQRRDLGLGRFHLAKAVEHDVGPLRRQRLGNTEPDSAGGSGDEGSFSFEHGVFSVAARGD